MYGKMRAGSVGFPGLKMGFVWQWNTNKLEKDVYLLHLHKLRPCLALMPSVAIFAPTLVFWKMPQKTISYINSKIQKEGNIWNPEVKLCKFVMVCAAILHLCSAKRPFQSIYNEQNWNMFNVYIID